MLGATPKTDLRPVRRWRRKGGGMGMKPIREARDQALLSSCLWTTRSEEAVQLSGPLSA